MTFVAPVTELRWPPAERIAGSETPVVSDSSASVEPQITSPSVGTSSSASTTTTSPGRRSAASIRSISAANAPGSPAGSYDGTRRAVLLSRRSRSAAVWERPRPSARASAALAVSSVSHSQNANTQLNPAGNAVPPDEAPASETLVTAAAAVVSTAPTSTRKSTGLRQRVRGSILRMASRSTAPPVRIRARNRPGPPPAGGATRDAGEGAGAAISPILARGGPPAGRAGTSAARSPG